MKNTAKDGALRRRDRAQSENDTESMFQCKYSSPAVKRFKQKVEETNPNEEDKEADEVEFELKFDTVEDAISDSSGEEEDVSDDNKKSPPIKRTMSLPRIKILENNTELPKIKEVDEEDKDIENELSKTSSKDDEQKPKLSNSLTLTDKKLTPPKITRQKSEEIREIKLKDSPYDEDFFYYFELYLEEAIKKITRESEKFVMGRTRSRSEV